MFQIKITVHSPAGVHTGALITKREASYEDLRDLVDDLQEDINGLSSLTLVQEDGTELTFPEQVLERSVFSFKIIESLEL